MDAPQTTLRRRISSELVRIVRAYVLLVTGLVATIAAGGTYGYYRVELAHYRAMAATILGTQVSNVSHELQSLAASPLLRTGLTDSYGREAYLAPLLAQFNRAKVRQFVVLDARGRVFLAPDQPDAATLAISDPVVQAVRTGSSTYGMRMNASGMAADLLLVQRVMAPQADAPIGFIVASIDAAQATSQINLSPGVRLSVAIDDHAPVPAVGGWSSLTVTQTQRVKVGEFDMALNVWASHPLAEAVILIVGVVLAAVALGWLMIRRLRAWSHRFAGTLTQRLERLVVDCQRLLAGEPVAIPEDSVDDELSEVTRALAVMMRKERQAADEMRTTALVFSTAAEGILVTDPQGAITDANPALCDMIGFSRGEILGKLSGSLYRSMDHGDERRELVRALASKGRWSGETHFRARDGRVIPAAVSISRIHSETGENLGHVSVITDVSKLKAAENKLRALAYRDALTGLPNFRLMSRQARQMAAALPVPEGRLAVLFIDLDQLKYMNDTYGHEAGDAMIKALAARLQQVLPEGHLLCRRSGDEFIAVVDITAPGSEAALRAILAGINPVPVPVGSEHLLASATIGISRMPQDSTNWQELQVCADVAMNEAKQTQRGTVMWYDARLGHKMYRLRQIQRRLEQAIEQGAIRVHYQPEVDLRTGHVVGFEALARWTDAELGEVPASEFIAVAEDSRLIEPLTVLVADTVLRDKPLLQARFPGAVVAFNVPPQVLRNPRLIKQLQAHAGSAGALDGLEIELTESLVARGEHSLLPHVHVLTELGVRLAIDDFGTGHSSLSRLAQLPISRLKIDRSFVADLHQPRQANIARLIVSMAHGLGFEVTAEGVEAPGQAAALVEMGCNRGQGWLYAPALPLEEVLVLAGPLGTESAVA